MKDNPILTYKELLNGDIVAVGNNIAYVTNGFKGVEAYVYTMHEAVGSEIVEWNHTLKRAAGKTYYTVIMSEEEPVEIVPGKKMAYLRRMTDDNIPYAELVYPEDNDSVYETYDEAKKVLFSKKYDLMTEKINDALHRLYELKQEAKNIQAEIDEAKQLREKYRM